MTVIVIRLYCYPN